MLAIIAGAVGFGMGWTRAKKNGGVMLDRLQWGAAFGLAFFLGALALTVAADWAGIV